MSIRTEILDELRDRLDDGLSVIVDAAERERLRRQSQPAFWHRFHTAMYDALPKWRRIARAWHKMQARRYKAMLTAEGQAAYRTCIEASKLVK